MRTILPKAPTSPFDLTIDAFHEMADLYIKYVGDPAVDIKKRFYCGFCLFDHHHDYDDTQRKYALYLKNKSQTDFDQKSAWLDLLKIWRKGNYVHGSMKNYGNHSEGCMISRLSYLAKMARHCLQTAFGAKLHRYDRPESTWNFKYLIEEKFSHRQSIQQQVN